MLPSARSVIVIGTIYNTDRPVLDRDRRPQREAAIARYAWGDDYHDVIQARLERLVEWLARKQATGLEARAYVDTGPVQERVYAQHAGLGWIGKNTCVINPELGSWMFLSEIICSLALQPDAPALDQCGTCTLCLEACPTGALVAPYVLDSRRCLSYLTIELKGAIPVEHRDVDRRARVRLRHLPGSVSVESRRRPSSSDPAWQPRRRPRSSGAARPLARSDDELRRLLKGSAMKRAGVRRLRRNLAVALGNSGDPAAIAALDAQARADLLRIRWSTEHVALGGGELGG